MINLSIHSIDEITEYFSSEINNLLFNPRTIAEELRESREMQDLDLCWIKILSSKDYRTDARNEASAEAGRKLAGIPFVKKRMELVSNQKMQGVAEQLAHVHRTLQQTFSSLIFYHFLQSCKKSETQMLFKVMGESFYQLPLI